MDFQREVLVMVVAPNGECFLVCTTTRQVYWCVETITKKYEAYHEGDTYMDVKRDNMGGIRLYNYTGSNQKRVSLKKTAIDSFIECNYSDNVNFSYLESNFDVDLVAGTPSTEDSNSIRIKKKEYTFVSNLWRLNFSTYEGLLPSGQPNLRDKDRRQCYVYRALYMQDFIDTCSNWEIQIFPNGDTLEDLRLKNRITKNKIKLMEPRQPIGRGQNNILVLRGTYEGIDVAVKRMNATGGFSKLYKTLWRCNSSIYTVRFFGAEIHGNFCYFAFERCEYTLREYMTIDFKTLGYSTSIVDLMRGLILGINYIHKQDLCHGNINPDNVMILRGCLKFSGMSKCKRLNEESKAWDIYCIGRLLLFCFTCGKYVFDETEDEPKDLRQIIVYYMSRRGMEGLNEIKDIILKMVSLNNQPSLGQLCVQPWLWDSAKRLEFIRQVSDTLQTLQDIDQTDVVDRVESLKASCFSTRCWHKKFDKALWKNMNLVRGYNPETLYSLLRFMRNYISHGDGSLGEVDEVEQTFRKKFPNLFLNVYNVMGNHLPYLPPDSKVKNFYEVNDLE